MRSQLTQRRSWVLGSRISGTWHRGQFSASIAQPLSSRSPCKNMHCVAMYHPVLQLAVQALYAAAASTILAMDLLHVDLIDIACCGVVCDPARSLHAEKVCARPTPSTTFALALYRISSGMVHCEEAPLHLGDALPCNREPIFIGGPPIARYLPSCGANAGAEEALRCGTR